MVSFPIAAQRRRSLARSWTTLSAALAIAPIEPVIDDDSSTIKTMSIGVGDGTGIGVGVETATGAGAGVGVVTGRGVGAGLNPAYSM